MDVVMTAARIAIPFCVALAWLGSASAARASEEVLSGTSAGAARATSRTGGEGSGIFLPPRAARDGGGGRLDLEDALLPSRGSAGRGPWYRSALVSLVIIVGLILGLALVARRWVPGLRAGGAAAPVRVLSRSYMTNRHSVAVVRVGPRVLVVGISPQQMTLLTEFRDAEEAAGLVAEAEASRPDSVSAGFRDWFERSQREFASADHLPETVADAPAEYARVRGALRGAVGRLRSWRAGQRADAAQPGTP